MANLPDLRAKIKLDWTELELAAAKAKLLGLALERELGGTRASGIDNSVKSIGASVEDAGRKMENAGTAFIKWGNNGQVASLKISSATARTKGDFDELERRTRSLGASLETEFRKGTSAVIKLGEDGSAALGNLSRTMVDARAKSFNLFTTLGSVGKAIGGALIPVLIGLVVVLSPVIALLASFTVGLAAVLTVTALAGAGFLALAGGIVALGIAQMGGINPAAALEKAQGKLVTATEQHENSLQALARAQLAYDTKPTAMNQLKLQQAHEHVADALNKQAAAQTAVDQATINAQTPIADLHQHLEDMATTLGQKAVPMAALLLNWVDKLIPSVTAMGVAVMDWFGPRLAPFLAVATKAFDGLMGVVEALGKVFGKFLDEALARAPTFGPVVQQALLFVVAAADGLLQNLLALGDWFVAKLPTYGPVVSAVMSAVGSAVQGSGRVIEWLADRFVDAWNASGKLIEVAARMAQTAWPQVSEAAKTLGGAFVTLVEQFWKIFSAADSSSTKIQLAGTRTNDTRDAFTKFMTSPDVIGIEAFFAVTLPAAILVTVDWLKVMADSIALNMLAISTSIRVASDLMRGDLPAAGRDAAAGLAAAGKLMQQTSTDTATAIKATNEEMDGTVESRAETFRQRMLHLWDTTTAGQVSDASQAKHDILQTQQELHLTSEEREAAHQVRMAKISATITSGQISDARQAKEDVLQQMREMHQQAVGASIIPDMAADIGRVFSGMRDFMGKTMSQAKTDVLNHAASMANGVAFAVRNGLGDALTVVAQFAEKINRALGGFGIHINVPQIGGAPQGPSGVHSLATGGVIPGYAPGRDTVPAMLSPGEGVLTPQTVRGLGGAGAIAALNSGGGVLHGLGAAVADVSALGSMVGAIMGQCVVAVEKWTGHYFPVAFASQMTAWINSRTPVPGSIFVSTLPPFGHTGLYLGGNRVIDSNWGLDERVRVHALSDIPNIAGYITGFLGSLGNLTNLGFSLPSLGEILKGLISPLASGAHTAANLIPEVWARPLANSLVDKIVANVSGRAGGGPVVPGHLYTVGERGPELFSTDVPGHITPAGGGTSMTRVEGLLGEVVGLLAAINGAPSLGAPAASRRYAT